jgi:hypothetical protein
MFTRTLRWLLSKLGHGDDSGMAAPEPPSQSDISEILASRREESALPVLTLREYRSLVEDIAPPNARQIEDFAVFVSEAKSWYKHLPLLPTGEPFTFFIDPWAGLDRILERDGRVVYVNRTSQTPKFHYTWMTTEEYRSRFGRLAFACAAGTQLFMPVSLRLQDNREVRGVLDNNPCRASIHATEEMECRMPSEALEAGTTRITGVVHKLAASPWVWSGVLRMDANDLPWPEETGGSETIRRIALRCRMLEKEDRLNTTDEELSGLIEPEQRRLQEEMVLAMKRVVQVLYGVAV